MAETKHTLGKVASVQGPVVDVKFPTPKEVPNIFDVIQTETGDGRALSLEVAEHLPGNIARCIAMSSTLGLRRNAVSTPGGGGFQVPIGNAMYCQIGRASCRERVYILV